MWRWRLNTKLRVSVPNMPWRPMLRDPADEMVLEAAANGRAAAIVTFNQRDFGVIPLQFGVEVLTPAVALRRIK